MGLKERNKLIDLNLVESDYHKFQNFSRKEKSLIYQNISANDKVILLQRVSDDQSIAENIHDLFFAIYSLPAEICAWVLLPYLYCSRQNNFENSSLDFILRYLSQSNIRGIITCDLHSLSYSSIQHKISIINLDLVDLIDPQIFAPICKNTILVAPDSGAGLRVVMLAKKLSIDYIISQGYKYIQTIELFSMVFKLIN